MLMVKSLQLFKRRSYDKKIGYVTRNNIAFFYERKTVIICNTLLTTQLLNIPIFFFFFFIFLSFLIDRRFYSSTNFKMITLILIP